MAVDSHILFSKNLQSLSCRPWRPLTKFSLSPAKNNKFHKMLQWRLNKVARKFKIPTTLLKRLSHQTFHWLSSTKLPKGNQVRLISTRKPLRFKPLKMMPSKSGRKPTVNSLEKKELLRREKAQKFLPNNNRIMLRNPRIVWETILIRSQTHENLKFLSFTLQPSFKSKIILAAKTNLQQRIITTRKACLRVSRATQTISLKWFNKYCWTRMRVNVKFCYLRVPYRTNKVSCTRKVI